MHINVYNRFGMRSVTLRWMLLAGTLVIGLIIAIQLYWLKHLYELEQKQFDTNTVKSTRGLFEDMNLSDSPASHLQQLISMRPAPNTFIIKIDKLPDPDTLSHYLGRELMDFDILTECKVALYDKAKGDYVFMQTIPSPGSNATGTSEILEVYPATYHYIMLQFPARGRYILSQMNLWIIGSIVVVLLLLGLAMSMFYFYKQKFLVEIQKDFVNNFTHEFKTPLSIMKIASDVLAQPGIVKQPERMEKYTAIISKETEHLQNQVERLLNMAVSYQRELRVQMESFAVKDLINQAISKLQPLVEVSGARVEIKIEDEDMVITADKSHLELAIVNLIENSIKYARSPFIVIEAGSTATESCISVKDNGIGIDKKYHKRIFKKFYRVPTGDVYNAKGFGLGLNFVKKIVAAHHGKIVVNSVPGIGTEFKIILPH